MIYAICLTEIVMVTEIELKAHAGNWEELKQILTEKAEYLCAFEKSDEYWFAAESSLPPSGLRIRGEKRRFADETEDFFTIATYKTKEVRDGIEVNDEHEFRVDPAGEFVEFLKRMGLKPGRSKKKRGWAFSKENITAELVEVAGLGWFVELEIISHSDKSTKEAFTAEKTHLLEFLDSLGIAREAIESRFYTEMLANK